MKRGAVVLAMALVACGGDPDRPPASGSSGVGSSSGAGSSSGSIADDSGTSTDGGGSTVAPGSIAAGLRASIDNGAREFSDGPKAARQNGGFVVELSGKDSFGNELRITMTSTATAIQPGKYDCNGSAGTAYGALAYVVSGGAATWTALAAGECTITVASIDNRIGGALVGTFAGTAKRASSTDYLVSKGEFRLNLE